jgi:hypothetical protein
VVAGLERVLVELADAADVSQSRTCSGGL